MYKNMKSKPRNAGSERNGTSLGASFPRKRESIPPKPRKHWLSSAGLTAPAFAVMTGIVGSTLRKCHSVQNT